MQRRRPKSSARNHKGGGSEGSRAVKRNAVNKGAGCNTGGPERDRTRAGADTGGDTDAGVDAGTSTHAVGTRTDELTDTRTARDVDDGSHTDWDARTESDAGTVSDAGTSADLEEGTDTDGDTETEASTLCETHTRTAMRSGASDTCSQRQVIQYDFAVRRVVYVHPSGSFDLYAPFFEDECGMVRTTEEREAGIVLGNEFELKRQIAIGGWNIFQPHARVLFLPGVVLLDDKIELARLLADAPYHPQTHIERVPDHCQARGWWIDKPARGSSGRGIRIVHNPLSWAADGHVLQAYANNPLLHRGTYKFDLRVLAIVFSDGRAFVYPDAIMRCCGVPYEPLPDRLSASSAPSPQFHKRQRGISVNVSARANYALPEGAERAHLTNVCVQAKYDSTQSHVDVLSRHEAMHRTLMPKASGVVLDVLHRWFRRVHEECDEGDVEGRVDVTEHNRRACGFRIVGFDILPLNDGRVVFIEANYQPGLARDGTLGEFYARALREMLRCTVDPVWCSRRVCNVYAAPAAAMLHVRRQGMRSAAIVTCPVDSATAPADLIACVQDAFAKQPQVAVSAMLRQRVSVLLLASQAGRVAMDCWASVEHAADADRRGTMADWVAYGRACDGVHAHDMDSRWGFMTDGGPSGATRRRSGEDGLVFASDPAADGTKVVCVPTGPWLETRRYAHIRLPYSKQTSSSRPSSVVRVTLLPVVTTSRGCKKCYASLHASITLVADVRTGELVDVLQTARREHANHVIAIDKHVQTLLQQAEQGGRRECAWADCGVAVMLGGERLVAYSSLRRAHANQQDAAICELVFSYVLRPRALQFFADALVQVLSASKQNEVVKTPRVTTSSVALSVWSGL